jgi:hypothetical protein
MIRKARLNLAEYFFYFISVAISISLGFTVILEFFNQSHSIFTVVSLLFFLLSSIICSFFAFLPSISAQLFAILTNVYFLHRIPLLYYLPEWLDYPVYFYNAHDFIARSSILFFLCIFALAFGILMSKIELLPRSVPARIASYRIANENFLSFFCFKASWRKILIASILISSFSLVIQIYAFFFINLGITGAIRNTTFNSFNTLLALSQLAKFFLPVGIFGLTYALLIRSPDLKIWSTVLISICLISLILIASRAIILGIIVYFYVAMRLLGLQNQRKYSLILFKLALFSIVLFPLISYSRYLFLRLDVSFVRYIMNLNLLEKISGRLGNAVESYFLWFKYITLGAQEQLLSIHKLFVSSVNGLVPGSIFTEPELVNIAKLQVVIGRPETIQYPAEFLKQLGGHGENMGQYGQSFMLFGFFAPFAFFVSGFLVSKLEYSRIHIFWKFFWIPILLQTPWLIPTAATLKMFVMIIVIIMFLYLSRMFFLKSSTLSR